MAVLTRLPGDTSDTPALNRFLKANTGESLTGGPYYLDGPGVYWSGCRLLLDATLVCRTGWASGHMLVSAAAMGLEPRTHDVVLDFSRLGRLQLPSGPLTAPARKGIGIRKVTGFSVLFPRVIGSDGCLFTFELIDCCDGTVRGGHLSALPKDHSQQGADGIHISSTVERVVLTEVTVDAGDDAAGLTVEQARFANSVQRDITFRGCVLRNRGHSSVKLLLEPLGGASLIENISFLGCRYPTTADGYFGAPFWLMNRAKAQGGVIRNVLFEGGSIEVVRPPNSPLSVDPLAPVIQAQDVEGLRFRKMTVASHLSRQLLVARGCGRAEDVWDASNRVVPLAPMEPAALAKLSANGRALQRYREQNGVRVSLPWPSPPAFVSAT